MYLKEKLAKAKIQDFVQNNNDVARPVSWISLFLFFDIFMFVCVFIDNFLHSLPNSLLNLFACLWIIFFSSIIKIHTPLRLFCTLLSWISIMHKFTLIIQHKWRNIKSKYVMTNKYRCSFYFIFKVSRR